MNWDMVLTICGINAVTIISAAFFMGSRLGALTQRIQDIDDKGCKHRRNGDC